MWNPETVSAKAAELGFKPFMTKGELKNLHTLLNEGEKVHGIIEGVMKDIHGKSVNGNGLLVATNKRVLFYRKSLMVTQREEIPLSKISSVSFEKGLMTNSLKIYTSNNSAVLQSGNAKNLQNFETILRQLMSESSSSQPAQTVVNNIAAESSADELEKLFSLKEKGILTEEEFQAKKKQLLGL